MTHLPTDFKPFQDTVITAAHCCRVVEKADVVVAGEYKIDTDDGLEQVHTTDTIVIVFIVLRLWPNTHWRNNASFDSLLSRAGSGHLGKVLPG